MLQLLQRNQAQYGQKVLNKDDFNTVMNGFALLDERCLLEPEIMDQLYHVLEQKQNGEVTYASIEVLVFEFLIQQPVPSHTMREEDLGPLLRRLPRSMIEAVDQELLKNLTNLHKFFQSKLSLEVNDSVAFSKIQRIGKALQNTLHIDTELYLRYFQVLVDQNDMLKNSEAILLLNELERALINHAKEKVQIIPNLKVTRRASFLQSDIQAQLQEQILNLSDDDVNMSSSQHTSHNTTIDESYNNQQKFNQYTNQLLRGLDHLRQHKGLQKQPDITKLFSDMMKLIQRIELKANDFIYWNEEKAKQIDEMLLERELVQSKIASEEQLKQQRLDQIRQMLEDNDNLYQEISFKDMQIKKLQDQVQEISFQIKSQSMLESEVKFSQNEIKRYQLAVHDLEMEVKRLQLNNKALLEIVTKYEQQSTSENCEQQNTNTSTVVDTQQWQLDELNQQIQSLEEKLQRNDQQLEEQISQNTLLQQQVDDCKRELFHFKQLYEAARDDSSRNSVMRPSQTLAGLGRSSNMNLLTSRVSNLGGYRFERGSLIKAGRTSSWVENNQPTVNYILNQRISQSPQISAVEAPPSLELQYSKPILNEILEEDEMADLRVDKNAEFQSKIGQDFSTFWDKHVQQEKGQYKPQYNPQYPQLEFDENILYERDYLGLRDESKINELLRNERNKYNQQMIRCYSDAVYRIDGKGQKSRRVIFCTEFNMYIFESEKSYKLTRQFPIEKITHIIFSEASAILCCLCILGSDDFLIETFKRSELNLYLQSVLLARGCSLFDLQFKSSFTVRFKGFRQPKKIEEISKGIYAGGSKQAMFKVSEKMGIDKYKPKGILQMYSKKWMSKDWQEVFVILCDVGLILFKKYGDFEPILFVPVADALVIKNPKQVKEQKPNMFKICYQSMDQEFLFCTKSPAETDEWHDMVKDAINNQYKAVNRQMMMQKSDIEIQKSTLQQH